MEESFINEYERAMKLKSCLLQKYQNKSLEETIPGKTIYNHYGRCYYIKCQYDLLLKKPGLEGSKKAIFSNLKLIYGIGKARERDLKSQGCSSLEDLSRHRRWGKEAGKFLDIFHSKDTKALQNWLWRWLPKSHPLAFYLLGICNKEDLLIFDIETMGLFGRPIVTLGVARLKDRKMDIHQYLLRDIPEEPSALWEFISHFKGNKAIITFNGGAFDIPYLRERLAFYGLDAFIDRPHFDILHFARRVWRGYLPDCRLTTIEKHILGIEREGDIPSALVPEFYETYLETQNIGPLVPIIEHNKQDLITLIKIFSKLSEVWKTDT